jgi:hypothetical protein
MTRNARPEPDGGRYSVYSPGWTVDEIPSTPGLSYPLDLTRAAWIARKLSRPRLRELDAAVQRCSPESCPRGSSPHCIQRFHLGEKSIARDSPASVHHTSRPAQAVACIKRAAAARLGTASNSSGKTIDGTQAHRRFSSRGRSHGRRTPPRR